MSIHGLGWKPDLPDRRDMLFSASHPILMTLPAVVDLRKSDFMPDNYNQGSLGSCTANSSGILFQYLNRKQHGEDLMPSRLFTYYNAREFEGSIKLDAGAFIRDAFKSLAQFGACPEEIWPYVEAKFTTKPKSKAYKKAQKHQAMQYSRVARSLSQMKACLAEGFPFVFGFTVYESFEELGKNGMMAFPKDGEKTLGGHAICVVGYDDTIGRLIIRNSWGKQWGDAGDFYMPYSYALDENLSDDFWTIRMVE